MSLLSRIIGKVIKPRRVQTPPAIRAGYDAADYDPANANHWQAADSYSPNAQLDSSTRQVLRDRSRYEAGNNGYYGGVIETIAGDTVGSGPRPQILIPGDTTRQAGRLFENLFKKWASASAWTEDLTLMQEAEVRDGESFALLIDNPGLIADGRTRVSLDLAVYEADQITDPWDFGLDPLYTDGVRVDAYGNPVEYTMLKYHPGGVAQFRLWDTETIPAHQVCHWYKRKRAGQTRGVPWMVAALPLFAQLRRYTTATLSAAELAAMLAGIMETDAPAGEQAVEIDAMDSVAMVKGALLTLPAGWKASQFKAEQPVTAYGAFKTEILNEVGRGGNVPLNIVSGNSSGYNYSSARLDRQLYYAAIRRQRERMVARFLDRIFLRWASEAVLVYADELAQLGLSVPRPEFWNWTWFWDGIVSIDPQKDADADAKNLENNTTTLAEICAERGQDWEDVIRQRAAEQKLIAELMQPAASAPMDATGESDIKASEKKFDESKVKRAEDGKFGSGSGGGVASEAKKEEPEEEEEEDEEDDPDPEEEEPEPEEEPEEEEPEEEPEEEEPEEEPEEEEPEEEPEEEEDSDEPDAEEVRRETAATETRQEAERDQLESEHAAEVKADEKGAKAEEKKIERDAKREEEDIEEKFRDEEDDTTERHEKEVEELERAHEREVEGLERTHEREVEKLERTQEKEVEKLEKTHEKEVDSLTRRHEKEERLADAAAQKELDKAQADDSISTEEYQAMETKYEQEAEARYARQQKEIAALQDAQEEAVKEQEQSHAKAAAEQKQSHAKAAAEQEQSHKKAAAEQERAHADELAELERTRDERYDAAIDAARERRDARLAAVEQRAAAIAERHRQEIAAMDSRHADELTEIPERLKSRNPAVKAAAKRIKEARKS
jgi:lambda family phage portal protein